MSFKLKLEFGGLQYNVLNFEYNILQATDATGRPSSIVRGGKITVSVESTGNTDLFAATADSFSRGDGKIIFLKRDSDATLKELVFEDAYIVEYTESFSGGGVTGTSKFDSASDQNPTIETVTFSAKKMGFKEDFVINEWPEAL